jgi:hypothetical protein
MKASSTPASVDWALPGSEDQISSMVARLPTANLCTRFSLVVRQTEASLEARPLPDTSVHSFLAQHGHLPIRLVAGLESKRADLHPRGFRRSGFDHLALLGALLLHHVIFGGHCSGAAERTDACGKDDLLQHDNLLCASLVRNKTSCNGIPFPHVRGRQASGGHVDEKECRRGSGRHQQNEERVAKVFHAL